MFTTRHYFNENEQHFSNREETLNILNDVLPNHVKSPDRNITCLITVHAYTFEIYYSAPEIHFETIGYLLLFTDISNPIVTPILL